MQVNGNAGFIPLRVAFTATKRVTVFKGKKKNFFMAENQLSASETINFWSDWPAGSVLGLETETSTEPRHCESTILVFMRDDTNI